MLVGCQIEDDDVICRMLNVQAAHHVIICLITTSGHNRYDLNGQSPVPGTGYLYGGYWEGSILYHLSIGCSSEIVYRDDDDDDSNETGSTSTSTGEKMSKAMNFLDHTKSNVVM